MSVAGGFVVDCTVNDAQPFVVSLGVASGPVVACAVPPVLEVNARLIESVTPVTVLFPASFTQTVIVDDDEPLFGIGFGEAVATRWVAAPEPLNETVLDAGVRVPDVAVAVHDSAVPSATWNVTVVPVDGVLAVAGLPAPPAGDVLVTVAEQWLVVLGT